MNLLPACLNNKKKRMQKYIVRKRIFIYIPQVSPKQIGSSRRGVTQQAAVSQFSGS